MMYEIDETFRVDEIALIDDVMTELMQYLKVGELDVNVTFERSEDASGGCIQLEDNNYIIELPNLSFRDTEIIAFIIHEMKHLEQYALGKLEQGSVWMGVSYIDVPYWQQPWEVEAYQFENDVLIEIKESLCI